MSQWTKEDSHITFQEAQSLAKELGDQADNPQWVANYILQLIKNDVAEMNQVPCDTCPSNANDACVEIKCPYM